jgi:hypothetical protein
MHPTRPQVVRAALAFAAVLVIGITASQVLRVRLQIGPSESPATARIGANGLAIQSAISEPESTVRVEDARPFDEGRRAPPTARATRVVRDVTNVPLIDSPAAVSVTAGPDVPADSLQLVRLRMPRTALQAFGVALIEPDATGLVDVDLVVGSDGLPRDIRRVRPVVDVRSDPNELEPYR